MWDGRRKGARELTIGERWRLAGVPGPIPSGVDAHTVGLVAARDATPAFALAALCSVAWGDAQEGAPVWGGCWNTFRLSRTWNISLRG